VEGMIEGREADEQEPGLVRSYDEVAVRVVEITPELAAIWLEANTHNRHQRPEGAAAYSRDMANEDWLLTGDTIKFDWYGRLMDGQHRLRAIVDSGRSIRSVVVWGVDPRAQKRMDTGMSRSFRDQLKLESVKHADMVSALCRKVHQWEPPINERVTFNRSRITHAELERTLQAHPELIHCANFVATLPGEVGIVNSLKAFLYWVLMYANADAAQEFMRKLVSGAGLEEGDPILVLRARLVKERSVGLSSKRLESNILWLTALAWNAWMDGRKVQKIQLPKGGLAADTFPRLRTRRKGHEEADEQA
jgi:hypothetical protein